jgi:lysophospholipase L1-like esterase
MMKKRILCFGDSNTYGFNTDTFGRFDEDTRWTCRLADELGESFMVIEEGLNARTSCFDDPLDDTKNGSKYLVPCLNSHGPLDLMVLMLGTNDVKQRFNATASNIAECIGRLILMAKREDVWRGDAKILVVAPIIVAKGYENAMFGEHMGSGCHEKSVALISKLEDIAKLNDCDYIDCNGFVKPIPACMMHIDEASQLPFAKGLKEKILGML